MADPFRTDILPDPMPTATPRSTMDEDNFAQAMPSALPPPVPSPVPEPATPPIQPEDRTLEEVYAGRRAMDFDEQVTGNNNPFGDQWSSAKSYRQEGKDITAMLSDRENLGGVAPDVVDLASESYDPQTFKDMATNWRATAFMLDTPVEQLKDSDYTLYKKLVAAKLGKNAPKTEGEYRQMLADHFNNRQVTEAALDDLNMMAVMDALNATNYGQEFPMVRDQGRTLSEWMAKYPELATPDRQWLLARNAGEMYRNTIDDLKDVRQFAAPTFKTLVAFTQGNATEEQLDELGRNLRDLTPEQFTKVSQYVSLAAEAEKIDRGAWAQLAKNLGESLSRGFDWIPANDIFSGQSEAANRLKAVEKDDVWVPVESESLPAGEYQNPRTARELPKYLQMASMGQPDETGYEEPLQNNWRKATPEEKDLIRQNAEDGMKSMKMVRKLRNLAKTGVDPIKPLAQGGLLGAVERGAYGLAGSIPLMGAVAVNPLFGVLAYQQNELDRILLQNEDMDLGAASTLALVEGGMNAVIDRFQLASLAGKSKVFGGVLKGMQKGGVANYLKRVGVIQVEQFAQEGAQDMIAPVVETIVASLREDMPDKDFMEELGNWWETRPEVFFATLPLALIGGGFASTGDLKNVNTEVTRERLRGAGISEEKINNILASETRAEMDERIQEAWQSRTEEDKARGLEYLNQQLQQIKQTDTDHNLAVERKEDGTAEWIVTDYKGEEVGRFGDIDAAMEVISQNTSANLLNEKSTTAELLNWASKVLENPDISPDEKPVSVAQRMVEMEGIGDQKGIDNLMARLKFGDLQGKDPNKLYILGETTIEQVRDGVYRAVIKLKENASPRDALEEINHGFFKIALANGTYTLDTYQKWLEQTEAATGRELKRATEMEVIESLAQVTEDFVMGRIEETSMPQSFVDYIKRIAAVFKEALARFLKMDEAFKTGAIDTDFQTALEQSLGINPQVRLDRISDQTAASIDPNLSVRDTSGDPDERASDPATESGDPAPDVKIDEIDPDKQTGKEWKEIPWSDDWNFSVRVLPTSFVPMDAKLFAKIKKESGGIIRSVFIDRMKAGGEYLGIPLQGGMGFPSIVENLKAGVGWAFNSKSTARALYNRAMDSGGYLALSIMVEGNVIGNKSFAMMWFEQLRQNIAAGKLTNAKALAELNRVREKYVTKKVDATRFTDIQKKDKNGKLKFNKDGSPVFEKEKIQATDEKGDLLFTRKGNPAWEKTDKNFTGHSTPWKSLAEAEKAIVGMPQGKRGSAYFKKTFNKEKNQADYQELLTKTNTKAGFPDAVQMVKDVEEPSFSGLPAQTIVGIIKIEKVPDGVDPAMTAKQLGVPEHKSYGFILKGKPVARMMKFRTLAEVKPSIAKEMMSQDNERWKMDDLISYSVKETKKSADQIAKIVGAMSASDIRTKLESSKLTPTPRMVAMLGEFPEYLEPIVSYMMDKRQDLVDGKVSPRDVAKAYWMTIASIGADAIDVATIGKKAQAEGISFNPDSMFTTTGTRGQLQMRPEELAAYWLGTPEGQRALDNVEKGVFNAEDWETGLLLRDAFGRNDLRERWRVTGTGEKNTNQTIMVDGNAVQVEVNENGKWSFSIDNKDTPVELPEGLTEGKRVQTSGSVGLPKGKKANLTNLKELTDRINSAKGDPEKLEKAVMSAVGIGEGKKGFVSHFLGFGGWSTIDAVELNIWLAGVGDTTRADQEQKMIAAIAKKASGQAATRRDLFERIREAILGLRDKAKGGKKIPKEVAPHIIHHWIWDAAKDIQTTHEGLYYAMQNYSVRETPVSPRSSVAPVDGNDIRVIETENAKIIGAALFSIRAFHGTPYDFYQFQMERIGTGEGAQAFGWGLYFAGEKGTAIFYRDKLTPTDKYTLKGMTLDELKDAIGSAESYHVWDAINWASGKLEQAKRTITRWIKEDEYENLEGALAFLNTLTDEDIKQIGGNLYQTDLDVENDELLDWDTPLSEQSDKVQAALQSASDHWLWQDAISQTKDMVGGALYKTLTATSPDAEFSREGIDPKKKASEALLAAGIKGIRYLDQGSRLPSLRDSKELRDALKEADYLGFDTIQEAKQAILTHADWADRWDVKGTALEQVVKKYREDGTYNYVLFDDSLIKITEKNGKPVAPQDAVSYSIRETERIAATALIDKDNEILSSPSKTHAELMEESGFDLDGGEFPPTKNFGFITTTGRFVMQDEAQRIAQEARQVQGNQPISGEIVSRLNDDPSYSIREQGEIDRVASAVDAVNRGPEGRLAVYQRAKLKFLQLMQDNKAALDAIKAAAVSDPAPAIEKLEEDRAGRLADIETEEIAEVQSALQDNAVQFASRIEDAIDTEDKATLKADARDRAKILEKGIREKYAERKKQVEQEVAAEKRKVSEVSESRRVASNAVYKEKVKYEKLAQAVAELDGLLKVLPKEVIGKVGGFATLTKIGGGEKALADFFVKRVEMVDEQLERYLNKEYDQELDRIFERAKPKKAKAGEKPKGIGAEIQNLFAILKEARDFSAREVSAHLAGIDDQLATGELTAEEEAALKQEAALVTLVGNWKPKFQGYTDPTTGKISYAKVDNGADSNRRATAIAALRETWARGFADYRAREMARREQRETEQRMAIQSTGKTGDMTKRKDKQLADAGLGAKFRNALFNLVSWDQFTALLFGNNSAVANRVSDLQRRADNQKEDAIQQKTESIEDLFTRLAGGKRLDGESLRWDMSQMSMVVDGLKLSELEGLTATMMWMQEDGKRHMEGRSDEKGNRISAWGYTQAFIDKIEGALSPEAKEVRQFLLDNYAREYSRINAVYRQLNGIDLPQIKNYSPLIVAPQNAPMGMVTDPVTGNAVSAASVSPGALRTRGTATAEPQFRDALQTFIAHTKQMEHWMAYAPMLAEVNGILRNREVQSAIEEKGGIEAKKVLNLWLDLFAQGGNRDASNQLDLSQQITGMAGRGAQMALVGRLGTLLVQTTQLGAAIAEMPTGSYVVRLSKLLTGNLGWGEALNSPYVQRRIREMPPVVQQALEGLAATQPNRLKYEVARIGRLISGTDGLMTAGTFAIVFDYHFTQAKKMGFAEAEARAYARNVAERATDRLAQPTRMGARSIFELTQTNAYAKVGWAFASEARKNLALAAYATANKSAGEATRTIAGLVFLNIIFSSLIRNAWKDARDEEDDEWFDDRNWSVKRMLLAAATEPFYGLPFIGAAIEEGAYVAAGEYNMTGSILSPTRAIRAMMKLPDTLSGERDIEDMMKDLQAVLSVMGLFNQNLAATTSISNIAIDAFTLGKNAKENLEN